MAARKRCAPSKRAPNHNAQRFRNDVFPSDGDHGLALDCKCGPLYDSTTYMCVVPSGNSQSGQPNPVSIEIRERGTVRCDMESTANGTPFSPLKGRLSERTIFFLLFISFMIFALRSLSLPVVTQIRGHIARLFSPPPSPHYVPRLAFLSREDFSTFFPCCTGTCSPACK